MPAPEPQLSFRTDEQQFPVPVDKPLLDQVAQDGPGAAVERSKAIPLSADLSYPPAGSPGLVGRPDVGIQSVAECHAQPIGEG